MGTDTKRAFNSAGEISSIDQLRFLAGDRNSITIELPISERAAFAQMARQHIASSIARTDTHALVTRLRELAAKYYVRQGDVYILKSDVDYAQKEGAHNLISDAFSASIASGQINSDNMTSMSAQSIDPAKAEIALGVADKYLKAAGYSHFSFLGCGTFATSFQALHEPTGGIHVIKLIGWEMDERVVKGRPVPDNLIPVFDNAEGMPAPDWSLAAFPKILPLRVIAEELGAPEFRIRVASPDVDADGNAILGAEDFVIPGALDLIAEMFTNSMSANCFPLDDPRPAIGLLPEGNLALFDMGTADYRYTDAAHTVPNDVYKPRYWDARAATYGCLGAPFRFTDDRGVPLSVMYFQPRRYEAFAARAAPASSAADVAPTAA